jgi:hypothetical protein
VVADLVAELLEAEVPEEASKTTMAMSILLKLQLTFQFSRLLTKRSSPTLRDSLQGDVVAVVDAAVVAAGGGATSTILPTMAFQPCSKAL